MKGRLKSWSTRVRKVSTRVRKVSTAQEPDWTKSRRPRWNLEVEENVTKRRNFEEEEEEEEGNILYLI